MLLERERQASRLAAALAGAVAGRGTVVVIEGAEGLGRTRLLRHAADLAGELTVLTASGSELEHDFGFGVVRQLLERLAAGRLDGAAALAGPALGLAAGASGDAVDDARFASLHGLDWLVANLAAERPLLLTVDDAQWADEPSLRFLAYLARRVGELPVALVVAARPPLPGEDRTLLEAVAAEAETLTSAPLSEAAIGTLAAERLGAAPDQALVETVHHATAGNALLVEELLAEVREGERGEGAASRSSRRKASRTARSRRHCSSPRPPSRRICATPSRSSTSRAAASSPPHSPGSAAQSSRGSPDAKGARRPGGSMP